jgi:hypothetical protein
LFALVVGCGVRVGDNLGLIMKEVYLFGGAC